MKKFVSLLIVLVLVSAFVMPSAFAAEDPQIVVSSVEAVGGEQIRLTVSLVNNPGFTNGKITVTYDESGLEFIKIDTETQDVFDNRLMAMTNGPLMNFVATEDVKADIELFYIYFKVKEGASGDFRVGLIINLMKNNAEEDLPFTVVQGVVSVKGQAGDPPATDPTEPTDPGQMPTDPVDQPTLPGETQTTKPGQQLTPDQGQGRQEENAPKGGVYAVIAAVLTGVGAIAVLIARKKRAS